MDLVYVPGAVQEKLELQSSTSLSGNDGLDRHRNVRGVAIILYEFCTHAYLPSFIDGPLRVEYHVRWH